MYESREMAFLLALVLVVEKGKRQYSVEFEHFVVFRKKYLLIVYFLGSPSTEALAVKLKHNVKMW